MNFYFRASKIDLPEMHFICLSLECWFWTCGEAQPVDHQRVDNVNPLGILANQAVVVQELGRLGQMIPYRIEPFISYSMNHDESYSSIALFVYA